MSMRRGSRVTVELVLRLKMYLNQVSKLRLESAKCIFCVY